MKTLHFEFGHVLRSRDLPENQFHGDGPVRRFDRSHVLRLSHKSSPDLQEIEMPIVENAFRYAQPSEELFLIKVNSREGWLRTVIYHEQIDGDMTCWTKVESNEFDSNIIVHSNILPYEPCWSFVEEWSGKGRECKLGIRKSEERGCTSRKEMKAADGNDKHRRKLTKNVWQITLKGGRFIGKTGIKGTIQAELHILDLIEAHPHIVYSFDHDCDEARELCRDDVSLCGTCEDARKAGEETTQLCDSCKDSSLSAYFMESLASDLNVFIYESVRTDDSDNSVKPPFQPEEAVDILLQIAKAMKHIHEKGWCIVT